MNIVHCVEFLLLKETRMFVYDHGRQFFENDTIFMFKFVIDAYFETCMRLSKDYTLEHCVQSSRSFYSNLHTIFLVLLTAPFTMVSADCSFSCP